MSQVTRRFRTLAAGCALLAALAVGCSKQSGVPFDPDASHPADFISTHPDAFRASLTGCDQCHGGDLTGGISTVSCYSTSRNGESCHPGGFAGHPEGWRALHSLDPSKAATCAPCHDNKSNTLPPDCFNNSLCHGLKSGHPSGWRTTHQGTTSANAFACAGCHPDKGLPSCFAVSACHGSSGNHPGGWIAGSQHGKTAEGSPGMATCTACHGAKFGGGKGPSCLTCHGGNAPHPKSNWAGESGRHHVNTANTAACALCHPQLVGSSNCAQTNGCHGGD